VRDGHGGFDPSIACSLGGAAGDTVGLSFRLSRGGRRLAFRCSIQTNGTLPTSSLSHRDRI